MIAALSLILTTKKLNSKIHMELVSVLINGRVHMGIINLLDLENGGPLSVLYRFNLNVRTTLATNMHGQVFFLVYNVDSLTNNAYNELIIQQLTEFSIRDTLSVIMAYSFQLQIYPIGFF